ncbi:10472_t:CDS:2, partial [Ambispora leptoticha]
PPPAQATSSSNLPASTTSTSFPPLFSSLNLDDVLRPTVLHSDPLFPSSTLSQLQSSSSPQQQSTRTIMFPYIFNDYISNLYNFTTNVPNSFLTFIHSLLHYSSTEMLELLLSNLMLSPEEWIRSDTQILYLCALLGPVFYRMDKAPYIKEFLLNILHLLHHVTSSNMRTEDITTGQSTLALEQIYDFLHHVKPLIASDHHVILRIQNIVRLMKPSIQNRLCGLKKQDLEALRVSFHPAPFENLVPPAAQDTITFPEKYVLPQIDRNILASLNIDNLDNTNKIMDASVKTFIAKMKRV